MSVVSRLSGAALGTHIADQTALVAVPLVAALAFGASPELIGVLVACQSSAHLIGSIPFGIVVDQGRLRALAITSAAISLIGFTMAMVSVLFGLVAFFGVSITLAGLGVVLFGLTSLSIVPRVTDATTLPRANAALELPRAISSFAAPLCVGLLIANVPTWSILAIAMAGSAIALVFTTTLPTFEVAPKATDPIIARIQAGGAYLVGHPLLRPIALCALFWNLAFAALLVVLVPAIQSLWLFETGAFGIALSAFGLGAILGSWLSGRVSSLMPPWVILLFGPGSSALAASGLLILGEGASPIWFYACLLLLGFGPFMWLIAQNSVRQLVSPPDMLGRVNAVIQTTIYGARPVGALMGGTVAGWFGPEAGLLLVTALFSASFAAAAVSDLRRVQSYAALKPM